MQHSTCISVIINSIGIKEEKMTAPKRHRTLTNKAQTSLGKMSAKALAVIDAR